MLKLTEAETLIVTDLLQAASQLREAEFAAQKQVILTAFYHNLPKGVDR